MRQSNLSIIKSRIAEINEAKEWTLADFGVLQDISSFQQEITLAIYQPGKPIYNGIIRKAVELSSEKINRLTRSLELAVEALEYMTMPITSEYPTTENLLETLNNDTKRGEYALENIAKILNKDK